MANTHTVVAGPSLGPNPTVFFTLPAELIMAMRGIDQAEVLKALSVGRSRISAESGNLVFRDGDLLIVAERDGEGLKVLTAVRDRDIQDAFG